MNVLREVWERATTQQPPPPTPVVVAAAVAAGLLVLSPRGWPMTRHVVTIVHEGAHALAALVAGRRLLGIRLHPDTSGLTVSAGRRGGPGMVVTAAAGYVGPPALGLGAAVLLGAGYAVGCLWALLVLLALLLVQIRNWFGVLVVAATGAGLFAVTWWLPGDAQSALAYLVTWFLLLSAPRAVLELGARRRRGDGGQSDADLLARLTGVPRLAWVAAFFAITGSTLALGARLLIG